jgi:hypothetical protein
MDACQLEGVVKKGKIDIGVDVVPRLQSCCIHCLPTVLEKLTKRPEGTLGLLIVGANQNALDKP